MIFLTETEIPLYCEIPGITSNMVANASALIECYIGDISEKPKTETIVLNRKNKGKLKYVPNELTAVSVIYRTPFGISEESIDISSITVDDYGYFELYGCTSVNQMIFGSRPSQLKISYTYGYAEDAIPDDLKRCCAAIAQNIKKRGWGSNEKVLSDLDIRLELTNDSLINSDIRQILNKYRGV